LTNVQVTAVHLQDVEITEKTDKIQKLARKNLKNKKAIVRENRKNTELYIQGHNGGNDRFSARLGILTILTIGFFVYGNQN
jgi:hypothetical protein